MAIPGYQEIMQPLLALTDEAKGRGDGTLHIGSDAVEKLAKHFDLSEEERKRLQPSGRHFVFTSRTWCARHSLARTKCLEGHKEEKSIPSGSVRITERGRKALEEVRRENRRIDGAWLRKKFPKSKSITHPVIPDPFPDEATDTPPKVRLQEAHEELSDILHSDMLEKLRKLDPTIFEKRAIDVLRRLGYGVDDHHSGGSGDAGLDGVIYEDKIGMSRIGIQTKRYTDTKVPPKDILAFYGALVAENVNAGVFITSSTFTEGARKTAKKLEKRVTLIDGEELVRLMIDNDIGCRTEETYPMKSLDSGYFEEEEE